MMLELKIHQYSDLLLRIHELGVMIPVSSMWLICFNSSGSCQIKYEDYIPKYTVADANADHFLCLCVQLFVGSSLYS